MKKLKDGVGGASPHGNLFHQCRMLIKYIFLHGEVKYNDEQNRFSTFLKHGGKNYEKVDRCRKLFCFKKFKTNEDA